ncbi:MAG: hypothetical protein MJ246_01180 [Clostridia bacterium]|nr:hypothetical protein [Clostridia bacterium]
MALRAIGDNVVVTKLTNEEKTESGIILNIKNDSDTLIGLVVSANENVKAGEKVLFKNGTGSTAVYEGQEYIILKKSEVLAVAE